MGSGPPHCATPGGTSTTADPGNGSPVAGQSAAWEQLVRASLRSPVHCPASSAPAGKTAYTWEGAGEGVLALPSMQEYIKEGYPPFASPGAVRELC